MPARPARPNMPNPVPVFSRNWRRVKMEGVFMLKGPASWRLFMVMPIIEQSRRQHNPKGFAPVYGPMALLDLRRASADQLDDVAGFDGDFVSVLNHEVWVEGRGFVAMPEHNRAG